MTPPRPSLIGGALIVNAIALGATAATGCPWLAVVNAVCVVLGAVQLGDRLGRCRVSRP